MLGVNVDHSYLLQSAYSSLILGFGIFVLFRNVSAVLTSDHRVHYFLWTVIARHIEVSRAITERNLLPLTLHIAARRKTHPGHFLFVPARSAGRRCAVYGG